ncbi:cation diffusion facilitator family transporter [Thermocrinis sp.]
MQNHCYEEYSFLWEGRAERITAIILAITLLTMLLEIIGGIYFNSVSVLADGIHMGTHALAYGVSLISYILSKRWLKKGKFSFGTWKIEVMGAYTSAIILGMFAILILQEAVLRLIKPEPIHYEHALFVAVIGLVVNLVSIILLEKKEHDINAKAIYKHILADAITSVFAIFSLLGGMYFGFWFLDPFFGLLGFTLIIFWAYKLAKECALILTDGEMDSPLVKKIIDLIQKDGKSLVKDIHILRLHHDKYACILTVETEEGISLEDLSKRLKSLDNLIHTTIELRVCSRV